MFQKIIKRGGRKHPKHTSSTDLSSSDPSTSSSSSSSSSINHSSRTTLTSSVPIPSQPQPQTQTQTQTQPQSHPIQPESLPLLRDVPVSDRPSLLLRKLRSCSFLFDLSDPHLHSVEKDLKRQSLLDLLDFLQSPSSSLRTPSFDEQLLHMITLNTFRSLPPHVPTDSPPGTESSTAAAADDDDVFLDPNWPHLQLVYEILLRYVVSPDTDAKSAKRHINHSFLLQLLDLFDSEDSREREYLKTILHRVYGKFMVHRPFIRKAIANVFYRFIYETERFAGVAELLEILGSIINGFALPMKEEHKLFLVRALLPLHKPRPVQAYHHQLTYCVTQFVDKDCKLADTVLRGLLKYWPLTNSQKEVLFLGELEEVLEATQHVEFQKCAASLFRQIARCLNSSHFQVAERALFLWNNDHIVSLIAQNRTVILPIIFESLEKNLKSHWNQAVHGLTTNVRKMFLDMDSDLFEECQKQYAEKEAMAGALELQRQLRWKRLETEAFKSGAP